ncbi:hypothetical protein, partial [Mesorhizobium sp.]|uniref:hypothetical protein n=1 Tax=Mesorhizobium sp. TaxID=1871066 RepID=UPI0025E74E89
TGWQAERHCFCRCRRSANADPAEGPFAPVGSASDLSQFGPNRGAIALDECRRIAPEIGSGFWNTRRRFKVVERTLCAQVDAGFPNALVGVKDVFE